MAENKPLPSPAGVYSKEAQDNLVRSIEDYFYQISSDIENVSFGKSTAISLYSKRELLLIPSLGIETIS